MLALLLALMLPPDGHADPPAALTLQVGAEQWGAFESMQRSAGPARTLTLSDGWIHSGFLDLWWKDGLADFEPGSHRIDPAGCQRRSVTVVQTLHRGLHARELSWTLIDSCPIAWQITSVENEGKTLRLESLTLVAREFAASR